MDCRGWGFVIRNNLGKWCWRGVKQGVGFSAFELEEAKACHFAMCTAMAYGYRNLVVDGDCQAFISKLHKKDVPNNSLCFFISNILSLLVRFDFIAWGFVKRGCNLVAHAVAHFQPVTFQERIWEEEGSAIVYYLATKDMCTCINHTLI